MKETNENPLSSLLVRDGLDSVENVQFLNKNSLENINFMPCTPILIENEQEKLKIFNLFKNSLKTFLYQNYSNNN